MMSATRTETSLESVETLLREELAQGDATISTAAPILRHLLVNEDRTLFSDDVVAHVRGMMTDLARQLLHAEAEATQIADHSAFLAEREDALAAELIDEPALLAHVHAVTLEAKLALQLQARCNIDAVLSPLLQELVAAKDDILAGSAMAVIAAQARFMQDHRRMSLPLRELPGELFHKALLTLRAHVGGEERSATVERALRKDYDEAHSRLGLLSCLVMRMGKAAPRALDIDSSGPAIFATALTMASNQVRDLTVVSLSNRQFARLALALRAAGLKQPEVDEQFLLLHPGISLPAGFEALSPDRASLLLASSRARGA
jgi:hypothetical protein